MAEESGLINFDVDEMTNRIIFGIPLFDSEGNPFPRDLLQSYLDSAISWAEMTLNICIKPRTLEERHDYLLDDYRNWGFVKVFKKPILEVESVELFYGQQRMYQIPENWIHPDCLSGQIQMFPTSGSSGMIITSTGGLVTPLLAGSIGYAPKMWKVKYKAGLREGDGTGIYNQTTLHPLLKDMIYRKACMGILGVWGDLIIGAGVANQSLSIDGLSQSIGTTQSAMFGGASARIKQLEEDVNNMLPALQSYYNGLGGVTVV